MERKRQREVGLAIVAVALIATAIWSVRSTNSPAPPAEMAGTAPRSQAIPPARDQNAVTGIDLQALAADRPQPEGSNRNPFRFKSRTPAERPSTLALPPPMVPPATPGPMGSIEPTSPPRIPLSFIGLVDARQDPKVGRVAILSDTRGVYYGRENETIEGRYRILKIGVESIDLAYLDGRGRQTIRLTGQQTDR